MNVIEKVHRYIREQQLIAPGDRVAVAVSGGADSVALFRVLVELRQELGVVLSVAHFNHKIRGADAEADEQFVRTLAEQFDLEFHCGSADVSAHAREHKLSLETAARELRHEWFAGLRRNGLVDKIATAHTEDDQAETVLMRIIRGAGTRGLAGIAPWQKDKGLVRPLLNVTRAEIEEYLNHLGQAWREDQSNRDLRHARNRIRHELLPLLQQNYNPAIRQTLADIAGIARTEEEYWEKEVSGLLARLVRSGKPSRSGRSNRQQKLYGAQPPSAATEESLQAAKILSNSSVGLGTLALDLAALSALPLALQRRVLRSIGEQFRVSLEFKHIQELLLFASQKGPGKELDLPGDLIAVRSFRELHFSRRPTRTSKPDYQYSLPVPGEVQVPELGSVIRAHLVNAGSQVSGYNSALLEPALLAPELTVRNWHTGDKFFPAHTRSPKKVKELLQAGRLGHDLSSAERKMWPVIESAGQIVWLRGFPAPEAFAASSEQAVLIEEIT